MQFSTLFSFATLALAMEDHLDLKQQLDCHGKAPEHNKHHKPCLFCPGACICKGKSHEKYPGGVQPEHSEAVYTNVHTETKCATQYDVHTSFETVTTVINHLSTATHVLHPEETFTLTRTESYVVWPAHTSVVENCENHHLKAPCAKHGKHGCCI